MVRRPSAGCALAILILAGCSGDPGTAEGSAAGGLSFLLITLDTTRADHLEPYGASGAETPNLARLARQGVVFERAWATTPLTLPSHASILTGLYPPAHGVRNNGTHYLSEDAVTLAEILRSQGFCTAAFVSAAVLDRRYGLDQGFEVYDDDMAAGKPRQLRLNAERPAAATVAAARSWLDGREPGQRFFLWVHLFDPHADYAPPPPWDERFRERPYDGEIAYLDSEVGRLLDHPRAADLVMVIADHGEGLGEHGEATHAMLAYDSTLRIPWLVRLPSGAAGRRVDRPVSQIDLLPTALDLLGLEADLEQSVAGRSQAAAILGHETGERGGERALYAETLAPFHAYGWAELRAVVQGNWKLIDAPTPELYDLAADPGELDNLAAERPGELAALRRALGSWDDQPGITGAATRSPDREMRQKLESLGYVAARRTAPPSSSDRSDPKEMIALHDAIERAQHLLHRGELDDAVDQLRAVLARDGNNLAALINLAKARAAQARAEEGIGLARRALELDPANPDLWTALGLMEASRGEFESALAAFGGALAADPRWLDARVEKARSLYRLGRRQQAEALVSELLAQDDVPRVQILQAELVELPAGRLEDAAERLRRALGREPYLAEGWRALGRVHEAAGRWRDALDAYRGGLERLPNAGMLHARAGFLLARLRRDEEAENHLQRAVALIPEGSAEAHNGLAAIRLRSREWPAAEAEARRALELDPHHSGAWNHLAVALEETGRVDEALASYAEALAADAENWPAEFNRALLLRKLGRFEQAAGSLRRVLDQAPDHAGAHFELGLLYAGPLDDRNLARRHLQASLDAAPDHPRASQIRDVLRHLAG